MTPPILTAASTARHAPDQEPLPQAFSETLALIKERMKKEHEEIPMALQSGRLVALSPKDWTNISVRAKSTRLACDRLIGMIQKEKPKRDQHETAPTVRAQPFASMRD